MTAVLRLAAFELRQQLRQVSFWVYLGSFFGIAFLFTASRAGYWTEFDLGDPVLFANSPIKIFTLTLTLTILGMPITAGLFGNAVVRDYQTGIFPLFFTTPVRPASWLGGRFLGSAAANVLVFLGIPLGILAAVLLPWSDVDRVAPFDPLAYLLPIGLLVVPNVLLVGGVFTVTAAHTRRMLAVYAVALALLVGYGTALAVVSAVEEKWVAWAVDAFGVTPVLRAGRFFTVFEQNYAAIPLPRELLYNRLLWLGIGLAVAGLGALAFRFRQGGGGGAPRDAAERVPVPFYALRRLALPAAARRFGGRQSARQLAAYTRRAVSEVVTNVYFPVMVGTCLLFALVMAGQMGSIYGTETFPVTYQVLELVSGTFFLFALILITFYAGELVWNERDHRSAQLYDSLPVADWVPVAARFLALMAVVVGLLLAAAATGVTVQAFDGYYRFEPALYAKELFVHQLLTMYLPLVVLSLTIHTVVNHKYLGHFLLLAFYLGSPLLAGLGLEHNLFHFGSTPALPYSDMNGYGHGVTAVFWFGLLWAAVSGLMVVASALLWPRGTDEGWAGRVRRARARVSPALKAATAAAGALALGTGGFIYYNTVVLNDFRGSDAASLSIARYEQRYKRFEGRPQPRVTAVRVDVDIHPREAEFRARGTYRLVNRSGEPIDSLFVDFPSNLTLDSLVTSTPSARVVDDAGNGFLVHALASPLAPGDSMELRFVVRQETQGFENEPGWGPVQRNGTFFNGDVFPTLGYNPNGELVDERERVKHGLPPRPRSVSLDDPRAAERNLLARDADWVDFEVVLSTSDDQIAVAPGYLQREWREGGRRFFHYRMDAPIVRFFSFLSARYAVTRDEWNGVAIEVYHHPSHTANVARMIRSVKASLEYYTEVFGPYQHRQVRILEFPRFAAFAQSFANTIPYSEAIGFIADVEDDDLDYPFFVTAHEVAHQWWGHQVVPADAQGAGTITETLSEYSALMVMERAYGRDDIGRFLRYERSQYLEGRGMERRGESPLVRSEGQGYVHYNKGAIAMYALREAAGEAAVNAALRGFLDEYKFRGPPYPTTNDLMRHLRASLPDSVQPLLTDWFEEVTLWDNAHQGSRAWRDGDGWIVEVSVRGRKMVADSLGDERDVPMDERVEIGVYGLGEGEPLHLGMHRVRSGRQAIRIRVAERPARVEVDPNARLIDRNQIDNAGGVRVLSAAPDEAPPEDTAGG